MSRFDGETAICADPVTLALIAAGTSAAAAGASGYSQYKQAQYQAGVEANNAIYADRQAKDAEQRGEEDLQAHYRKVSQVRAMQQVGFASAGVDTSFGSPLDVMGDTTAGGNADAGRIAQGSINEQQGFLIGAQNARAAEAGAKFAAKSALVETGLKVGSTLISGASTTGAAIGKYGAPKWMGATGQKIAAAYAPKY